MSRETTLIAGLILAHIAMGLGLFYSFIRIFTGKTTLDRIGSFVASLLNINVLYYLYWLWILFQ